MSFRYCGQRPSGKEEIAFFISRAEMTMKKKIGISSVANIGVWVFFRMFSFESLKGSSQSAQLEHPHH